MYSQHQVDGYLVTAAKGMEKEIENIAVHKKPVGLIDSYFPNDTLSHVLVANYKGMMMGMNHLYEQGYENIVFVTVKLPLIQMEERKLAFKDALMARNIRNVNEKILEISFNTPPEEVTKQVRKFIRSKHPINAVFFATNYLGIPGLEAIQQEGLSMPRDIAMICFDDHELFRLFPNGITAIRQPIPEIAKTAINLLIKQLEAGNTTCEPVNIKLPPALIRRGST